MYVCGKLTQVDLKSVSNRIRRGNGIFLIFFFISLQTILFVRLCPSCEQAMC